MSIPAFNAGGVLPPFTGSNPGDPATQSPYRCTMMEVVEHFGNSLERAVILEGLFAYRDALLVAGIKTGFQWLDGSFVEDVERLRGRPPGDVDVVTVLHRPSTAKEVAVWEAFVASHGTTLFDPSYCKANFRCDAYPIDLDAEPMGVAEQTAYWFGLFAHQRDTARWKGIIQVPLGDNDSVAISELRRRVSVWSGS